MIIHFFNDEDFVDWAIDQFEAVAPNKHTYLVLTEEPVKKLKRVKAKDIKKVSLNEVLEKYFLADLANYNAVCFHFLTLSKAKIINSMPSHNKVVWICWGKDAYNEQFFNQYFLEKKTKKLSGKSDIKQIFKELLKNIPLINKSLFSEYFVLKKALKRVNYLAPMIKDEYTFLTEKLKLTAKYIPFAYGSLEDVLGGHIEDKVISGKKNILLGNSSTPTNNHIEALNIIKSIDKCDYEKIYLPLNYGNHEYGKIIEKEALKLFPRKSQCLNKRLSINDYTQLMMDCNIVIMNHIRQQEVD